MVKSVQGGSKGVVFPRVITAGPKHWDVKLLTNKQTKKKYEEKENISAV